MCYFGIFDQNLHNFSFAKIKMKKGMKVDGLEISKILKHISRMIFIRFSQSKV